MHVYQTTYVHIQEFLEEHQKNEKENLNLKMNVMYFVVGASSVCGHPARGSAERPLPAEGSRRLCA